MSLFNKKISDKYISKDIFGEILLDSLITYVESIWDDNKLYIMSHSSGYDSRIISAIIKKLGKTNIKFISFQPEIKQFREIMSYEGWSDDHIITIRPKDPMENYFASATKFEEVGKYSSDANKFITYCFRYVLEKEIEQLDGNIQIISGLHSDEVLKRSMWPNLAYFTVRMLSDIFFEWGVYNPILPFVSFNFLDVFTDYKMILLPDDMKKIIIKKLDPELFYLENYRFTYFKYIKSTGTHPAYKISEFTRSSMLSSYNKSWYSRMFNKKIILPLFISNRDDNYREYIKAAICEYLLNKGCELKIK